jgi:hypothetical protein
MNGQDFPQDSIVNPVIVVPENVSEAGDFPALDRG